MQVCVKPKYAKNLFFRVKYQDYPILHQHTYWEFVVVLKGSIVHKINGETMELSQNSLTLIRPHDAHSLHNKKKQPSQHLNLGIDAEYFKRYLDLVCPSLYDQLLSKKMTISVQLSLAKANRIINDMNKALSASQEDYERQLELLFLDVVREFYSDCLENTLKKGEYSALVKKMIMLMNNPDNMKRDLKDLIAEANYSYSHTNRVFVAEVGCTPSQYFRDKKFDYAKTLIGDTDIALTDVAYTIGYENYAHFSTAFKKYTGFAPVEYGRDKRGYYQFDKKE